MLIINNKRFNNKISYSIINESKLWSKRAPRVKKIINLVLKKSNYFIDISAILSDEDSFILSDLETKKIRMGQPVYRFSKFHNKLVTIYNKNNIIGIAVIKNNCIYPKRLINFNE